MIDKNSLGSILIRLRKEKRKKRIEAAQWTQEAVAKRIPVSRVTYIAWEKDEWQPDTEHLKRIIEVFRPGEKDEAALYRTGAQPPPELFHVPFLENRHFTGRVRYLEQLRRYLIEDNIVAISGLGGVGKTQITLKYAYDSHPDTYRTVLWVNAADATTLQTDFASLAQALDLPEKDTPKLELHIEAVQRWLQTHTKWLLIMDNADDLPIIRPYLLMKPLGHIVLTTRWQFPDKFATPLAVETMEIEEGMQFLYKRSGVERNEADDAACRQIVERLGALALALEQAGAYIQETGVSFSGYVKVYQETGLSLLGQYGALDDEHKTVATTLETSLASARKLSPMVDVILSFSLFLLPDRIPEELFYHDDSFVQDIVAFNTGFAAIQRYSLVKRNAERHMYSIHPLVREMLFDSLSPEHVRMWRSRVLRCLLAAYPAKDFTGWAREGLRHVMTCAGRLATDENRVSLYASMYEEFFSRTGLRLHEPGQQTIEVGYLLGALFMVEQEVGFNHAATGLLLEMIGTQKYMDGKYELAEPLLGWGISKRKEHLGEEYLDIVDGCAILADTLQHVGKHEDADKIYRSAINFAQKRPSKYLGVEQITDVYVAFLRDVGRDAEAAALEAKDEPPE